MKFATALIAAFGVAEATRYKSGAVTGFEKFTYGKFIARIKAPNKKGTVSSFFTYWNGPDFFVGGWNELDVEIVPSVEQNPFSMNIIYGDGYTKRESHDYAHGFDPKDDWHIYEMAWTPDYIAWSLDDREVRRVERDDPAVKYMSKGQSVMMNFWTPTFESWGKGFDAADMPWYVYYDYVETYTYNSETKGFDFHWKDDFNTFDSNRWHKSDNTTFDANSTTFRATQAYVDAGKLVLKMEPDYLQDIHGPHKFDPALVTQVKTEPTISHKVAPGTHLRYGDIHLHVDQPKPDFREVQEMTEIHPLHEVPAHMTGIPLASPYPIGYPHDPFVRPAMQPIMTPLAAEMPFEAPSYFVDEPRGMSVMHERPAPATAAPKPKTKAKAAALAHKATPKTLSGEAQKLMKEAHVSTTPKYYDEMFNEPGPKNFNEVDDEEEDWENEAGEADENEIQKDAVLPSELYFTEHDETPYEHFHQEEMHQPKVMMSGHEHHPGAHFEQGYWDLPGHVASVDDDGYFSAEEHGSYHYIAPERSHHTGHYYAYADDREHYPQHVD